MPGKRGFENTFKPYKPDGIQLIAAERNREIAPNLRHDYDELALAAAAYAIPARLRERFADRIGGSIIIWWPWQIRWWRPTPDNRIRELTKAGALIAAEIDRLIAEGGVSGDEL
ncbi:hypothetical protein [Acetonema longum]|uniref:Uncharacterized protein n=1 Tax=Acetonema longum DSM 6540 TaxID=1009370 RepID=F7NKB7_9FIRM|nr:hypothetical protein [Acetonema longum]EGO63558.1 hypothetical protein ALO_12651 [Acetonema longum DSM 6540]